MTDKPIEKGMFGSDRCMVCGDFGDKIKPWICYECWELIKQIIKKYKDELLE